MDFLLDFFLGWVPWWAWAGVALLALGGVYKWVGWQGMLALLVGVAAFFGYRQGYNDKKSGAPPIIPVDLIRPPTITPPPRKKHRTVMDIINGS